MILAASINSKRKVLFLGLTEENMDLLRNDHPIHENLQTEGVPGLEEWDLYILGPEDTIRFVTHVDPEGKDGA